MPYRRCGRSGLKLPPISLGLWQNFGDDRPLADSRAILRRAFDLGITHFDLANNYGPPYGSAEINFGRIYRGGLRALPRRAGHLDQGGLRHVARALRGVGLAQVPARQPGPEPPAHAAWSTSTSSTRTASIPTRRSRRRWARWTPPCAQGKARYVGISSYGPRRTEEAAQLLRDLGTPLLIHQPSYSMFNRWIEDELLDVLDREGVGAIVFSPLAQGLLTDKYLDGIPEDSRVRRGNYFSSELLTDENLQRVRALNEIAQRRGQTPRADGDRLGAARPARHLGAARRLAASPSSSRTSRRSTPTTSTPPSSRRSTATRSTAR